MQPTQKIALIDIENRKVRMARTKGQTLFYNVGGRVEPGETREQTLIREGKEEMDVDIIPGSLVFLFSVVNERADRPGDLIEIHCYTARYTGEPKASSEVEELDFFSTADGNRTTPAGRDILGKLSKELNLID